MINEVINVDASESAHKYFRRSIEDDVYFLEPRPAEWGKSAIYYETSEEGFSIRQVQIFQSGIVLAYDKNHLRDHLGWLDPNPVCDEPSTTVSISQKEFQTAWFRHADAMNWKSEK